MNKPKERTERNSETIFKEMKQHQKDLDNLSEFFVNELSKKLKIKKTKNFEYFVWDFFIMSKTYLEFEKMINSRWAK